jgi:hypothetical protein
VTRAPALVRLVATLLAIGWLPVSATTPADDAAPDIALLTVGPGMVYWERFGHNAIVVHDRDDDSRLAYNYGLFDFDEQDFLLNFVRGRMRYRIGADPLQEDLAYYLDEGRRVTLQHLDFTPRQARALAAFLEWNARPENAYYHYDYFTANCSTRVRDALDRALDGSLRRQLQGHPAGVTFRSEALRLMAPEPLVMLAIDLGLGPFADHPLDQWQDGFVPAALAAAIAHARIADAASGNHLLAGKLAVIAPGSVESPPQRAPPLRARCLAGGLAIGVLLLALAYARRSRIARIGWATMATLISVFCGAGGVILLLLWGLTDHVAAWRNENLLLLDPLYLLLVPALVAAGRGRQVSRRVPWLAWAIAAIALFALVSKALPWFVQANLHWILLFLPIHIAVAMALTRSRSAAGTTGDARSVAAR